jgi:hypothetical protein
MMTVAVEVTPLHVTDTVFVNVPAVVPAVNKPVCVIVPPPATTDQTGWTFRTFPSDAVGTATNCWVPPVATVAVVGVRASAVVTRGSEVLSHAPANTPANATAVITRAIRVRLLNARKVRLLVMPFIELLLTGCM